MAIKKNIIITLLVFVALLGAVFANPINVADMNIQEVNGGDYIVVTTLSNSNVASGSYEDLSFMISSCGTSKSIGVQTVDNTTKVVTKNLKDIIDTACYDSLKVGETYTLVAQTSTSNKSESFLFGSAQDTDGLTLTLDTVKVNGETLNDNKKLSVENGKTIDVDLIYTALENIENARFMISLDGYEHSTIVNSSEIFSAVSGITDTIHLSLALPADMDSQKEYKLRITGANDLSGMTYKDYNVYVNTERHRVDILDMVMTPSTGVEAGQNVIANVQMINRGQKSQDRVKVNVAVPKLGLSESSYVTGLDPEDFKVSDDMLLIIPDNAKAGNYEIDVTLSYDDGYTTSTKTFEMTVLQQKLSTEKNLILSVDKKNLDLVPGEASTFNIVIANPNKDSKPISIVSADANVWADVEVSPSLDMIQGGDEGSFTVTVTPKSSIVGTQDLVLYIKSSSATVSDITVPAYVEGKTQMNWVNITLAVLLIIAILILLSLVISIATKKDKKEDDEDFSSNEEYY